MVTIISHLLQPFTCIAGSWKCISALQHTHCIDLGQWILSCIRIILIIPLAKIQYLKDQKECLFRYVGALLVGFTCTTVALRTHPVASIFL